MYVPNVHLERSANLSITDSKIGILYVYRIPAALNCNGTVVGVEFCYNSDGMKQDRDIFAILPLMEVGVQFNVTSSVLHFVGDPTKDNCSGSSVCCNRLNVSTPIQLSGDQLFVFGILIPRGGTTRLPFMSQYVLALILKLPYPIWFSVTIYHYLHKEINSECAVFAPNPLYAQAYKLIDNAFN